jgi:shikimate dehydrogenase
MKKAYLFGYPIGTSWSPVMHRAAFERIGMQADYEVLSLPPEQLREAVGSLRHADVLGGNITMPYKETVFGLLDAVDSSAESLGAVNTVVNAGGKLIGHNTDIYGAEATLRELNSADKLVTVFGAGGAARAVLGALAHADLRPRRVVLINRSPERLGAIGPFLHTMPFEVTPALPDEPMLSSLVRESELIVNTTTAGALWSGFDLNGDIWDVNYGSKADALREHASLCGLSFVDGSLMLAAQAQRAFALWMGQTVELDLFVSALTTSK